ncbi:MAG TPA: hypothetical protein VIJ75_04440 [Hanamia sp.]
MLSKNLFIFYLISCLLFFACNEQDKLEIEKSASAFDIKQGEASILQSNKHFMKSFEAGDSTEVGDSYTTNAALMVPNQATVNGRKNIIHYYSLELAHGITHIDLNTIKIWGDSSILAEEGTYKVSDMKKNNLDQGKYIVLWKQETGNWKMYRDIWASDLPVNTIKVDSSDAKSKFSKRVKK